MKKPKFNYRSPGFVILLLLAILTVNTQKVKAQSQPTGNKLLKYELSIDLVPIIDQGQFGTILFKVYNINQERIKGAYRFGMDANFVSINNPDANKKNIAFTYGYNLIAGYEKHVLIGRAIGYYGIDFKAIKSYNKNNPMDVNDQQNIVIGATPFLGIKQHINNKLSISFELGVGNKISFVKTFKEPIHKAVFYGSEINIPYNFTLNYHF
ncbi:MAG: hypothetical protein Q8T04_09275 [Bacteroidota bacterium]|nr:hypothetical protein [Bacteroidota bacterium]